MEKIPSVATVVQIPVGTTLPEGSDKAIGILGWGGEQEMDRRRYEDDRKMAQKFLSKLNKKGIIQIFYGAAALNAHKISAGLEAGENNDIDFMKKISEQESKPLISEELLSQLPPSARKIYRRINELDKQLQEGWDRIRDFYLSKGIDTPRFPLDSKSDKEKD